MALAILHCRDARQQLKIEVLDALDYMSTPGTTMNEIRDLKGIGEEQITAAKEAAAAAFAKVIVEAAEDLED